MKQVSFNRASLQGNELEYMRQAIDTAHISGDGVFTKKVQSLIESILNVAKVLLTTSCTDALEMSALLLDIKAGDEVIVPAFTFVSTANAFVLRGAKPIFIDIRPDTLNVDETKLEQLITPQTKAIIPVHYAGVGCEMDVILSIAKQYNLYVVEDNAHGMFGKYKGEYLGTFGQLATQSFHETKNFTCGEGGALLINDENYIERAEIIREKGTNRNSFFRGQVDKYTWVDVGSSYLLSDILAAFLYAQLEARKQIQQKRHELWQYYSENLVEWAFRNGVQLPTVPAHCEQAYHMFYMLMPSLEERQSMLQHLKQNGITSVFHYLPLHLSKMGQQFSGKLSDCPVTEDISNRILRLPYHNTLTEENQRMIVDTIYSFQFK
jgi:dTDP-4-amino-4,6-dideoxygalactose transaminase